MEDIGETSNSQDDQLITSLLTQFQYASVHTIWCESKTRTYQEAIAKLEDYIAREAFQASEFAAVDVKVAYMCCVEDDQTFDICQKLVSAGSPATGRVISKYAYCIQIGDIDEEKKANAEDEEVRCAQELYEGFRAEEVEFPILKTFAQNGDEMLEENIHGDVENIFSKNEAAAALDRNFMPHQGGLSSAIDTASKRPPPPAPKKRPVVNKGGDQFDRIIHEENQIQKERRNMYQQVNQMQRGRGRGRGGYGQSQAYGASGDATNFSVHAGRKPFSNNFSHNYYNNSNRYQSGVGPFGRFEPVYRGGSRKVRIQMKDSPLTAQGKEQMTRGGRGRGQGAAIGAANPVRGQGALTSFFGGK